MYLAHTIIHIYLAGWVGFIDIRIVQSYVVNCDRSKSSLVLQFFFPVLALYCTVLCHNKTVWEMARKFGMDLET
jgi:hypothetical protein